MTLAILGDLLLSLQVNKNNGYVVTHLCDAAI